MTLSDAAYLTAAALTLLGVAAASVGLVDGLGDSPRGHGGRDVPLAADELRLLDGAHVDATPDITRPASPQTGAHHVVSPSAQESS